MNEQIHKAECKHCIHWKNSVVLPGTLRRQGECWLNPPAAILVPLQDNLGNTTLAPTGYRLPCADDFVCHQFADRETTPDPLARGLVT